MHKKSWIWLVGVVVLVVGGVLGYIYVLKPNTVKAQTPDQITEVVVVTLGTLRDSIESSGNLAVIQERALSFETSGRVAEIYVQVGDPVKAGQPLLRLDTTTLELSVAQAQADLDKAQIQLEQTLAGPTKAELAAAEAALNSARASYAQVKAGTSDTELVQLKANLDLAAKAVQQAQGNYERSGGRSAQALQSATIAYDKARAAYEIGTAGPSKAELASAWSSVEQAQANLDELKAGATAEEIQTAQLNVQQAQLALNKAQRQLAQATLVAPFDGVVTALNVAVGEMASGSVVTVADLSALEVEISLDESDVTLVHTGQTAQATIATLNNLVIPGAVTEIAPAAEVSSGVAIYPVTVRLSNRPDSVRPGMLADLEIITAQWDNVLYLPQRAVQMDGDQAYVMRQTSGGQFERVAVTLGKSLGGNVEIVDGLAEGDIIGVVTQVTATTTPEESSGFRMPGLGGLLGGGGGRP